MQPSRYLLHFPLPEQPGQSLLFSTRRTSLAMLDEATLANIAQDSGGELAAGLARLGMLVPDLDAERKEVRRLPADINRLSSVVSVSIILGLACNFRCTYCFEGTLKGDFIMADATADQLVAFIKARFTAGKKKLLLHFYGGEPLLYQPLIKRIAGPLQTFVSAQGGELECSLVTNGSLLSPETVRALLPYGLTAAKVTVDGPAANHNRTRPFRSGAGSFDTIIKNISESCELLRIGIGGNYTSDNYRSFLELLDLFAAKGLTPEKLGTVKFDPVMAVKDQHAPLEFCGGCATVNEPWLFDASLLIREEILKRGYKHPKLRPAGCMVDLDDAFTVHYDGRLYKCVAMIGHHGYEAGDIWTGFSDFSTAYNADHWRSEAECRDCIYLPICYGGCRYMQYQRTGAMAGIDCQKPLFDATLEAMLKQDIKYNSSFRKK